MQHLNVGVHPSERARPCAAIREEALAKERVRDARQMGRWLLTF